MALSYWKLGFCKLSDISSLCRMSVASRNSTVSATGLSSGSTLVYTGDAGPYDAFNLFIGSQVLLLCITLWV